MNRKKEKRVYISGPQGPSERAKAYVERLRADGVEVFEDGTVASLQNCDVLLMILVAGESYRRAKADLNYALDHAKDVICLTIGEVQLDRGFAIQLGLATKIMDDADGPEKMLSVVRDGRRTVDREKRPVILLIVAAVIAIAVAAIIIDGRGRSEDTPGTVDNAVAADDLDMESSLRDALLANGLDKDGSGGISREELGDVQKLDLSNCDISDITPLVYAENLTELDLSGNEITDVTTLVALKKLHRLNLSGNPVEDMQMLDFLPELREVILDEH